MNDYHYNFPAFFFEVFLLGVNAIDGKVEPGKHIWEWCARMQVNPYTATVSSRYHIKTTVALGYLAWKLYNLEMRYNEWFYFGYTQDLAGYHLARLKRYLEAIPEYFDEYKSLTDAASIVHYEKNGHEFKCVPMGILAFKRGPHPNGIICDDILRDPEIKLDISQLQKIETTFVEQVMPMPKNELHVFGTPQDEMDLFHKLETMSMFNCKRYPAITNEATKEVLWPEVWPFEKLIEWRKNIGDRAFNKEFQCRPVRSQDGYFMSEELDKVIKKHLKNYGYTTQCRTQKYCYGGFDLGKKRHPSHITIFAEDRVKRLVQIASIWLDGIDYTDQLEVCKVLGEHYQMHKLFYDDTRAELEGFNERGELPAFMEGKPFTVKFKNEIAAMFEKEVRNKTIMMLPDERQKRQILNVDNDLKSVETNEGHGDSFWSVALACYAAREGEPNIRIL